MSIFKLTPLMFLFISLSLDTSANENIVFHEVKALSGDGVLSMLRRYKLDEFPCQVAKFYKLNDLEKGAELKREKLYKIPVILYTYDSKSIRSTINQNDWDIALKIKKYNEIIQKDKLRQTSYIDSKILWVPFHYVKCDKNDKTDDFVAEANKEADIKTKTSKKSSKKSSKKVGYFNEPLFGQKHAKVKRESNELDGKVYYVVSGHGGPDPGARCTECVNTLCEDEYAYDVSLRIARKLMAQGATVHIVIQDKNDGIRDDKYLICDYDEICMTGKKIPLNQLKRLEQRANAINDLYKKYELRGIKEQYCVILHVDSRTEDQRQDVFFYHYEHSKPSKKLAEKLHETFKTKYDIHQKNRGYKGYVTTRNLYMIRNTLPPAVYIELANIRNPADQKRLLLNSNRDALASWIFEGLITD